MKVPTLKANWSYPSHGNKAPAHGHRTSTHDGESQSESSDDDARAVSPCRR
eukprot:CAMPEP_0194266314 /NCGR_PEP_ID=MMETSP0169-20130528/1262_1 /TAXON_ID=218684 /ORGANISM="Corethron pennatum, Strain L29A3" /LENGTH=50 /DNA_ID=CAMNT_0039006967 /DNA_START=47 /DNA_END=195 /DNA_ORIENTATION=+